MKKIAILISGQGSTLQAIIEACQTGFIPGKIVTVISNKIDSFGLERAKSADIPNRVFLRQDFTSNLDMDKAIGDYLEDLSVDLIVLAGYMKILTKPFTQRFTGKILNIHPALLPSFPGLHGHQQAIDAGVKVTGCTVHFVDAGMDTGPIIMQNTVPVYPDDTEDTLSERLLPVEHATYREALRLFCEDALRIEGRIVHYI